MNPINFRTRKPTSLDELFPQDILDYYITFQAYIDLQTENYIEADKLARIALARADRWNELAVNSSKMASADFKKTDLATYCLNKYSVMKKAHDQCRMIWKAGVEATMQRPNF